MSTTGEAPGSPLAIVRSVVEPNVGWLVEDRVGIPAVPALPMP